MQSETLFCPNCNGQREYTTRAAGPHLRADCKECGKYIKFLPTVPIDKFKMPFGKYKGKYLVDVATDEAYFEWLFNNSNSQSLKDRILEAINICKQKQKQKRLDF